MPSPVKFAYLLSTIVSLAYAQSNPTKFTFVNNCTSEISLYHDGTLKTKLVKGANTTLDGKFGDGYYYTDANGGGKTQKEPSTKFTTYGSADNPQYDYYIVRDPKRFNVGMRVEPDHAEVNGFCKGATCESADCKSAFPADLGIEDLPGICPEDPSKPPDSPLYSCPIEDIAFKITFCPSGQFPPTPSAAIGTTAATAAGPATTSTATTEGSSTSSAIKAGYEHKLMLLALLCLTWWTL